MHCTFPYLGVVERSSVREKRCGLGQAVASATSIVGRRVMFMSIPAITGGWSTVAISDTSNATRFRSSCPNSGWVRSRPLNMMVTFTLCPLLRKRRTWLTFVW